MEIRVCCHSSTGNTMKLARSMALALDRQAEAVEGLSIKENVDLLFLGGAVYATEDHGLHPALRDFIARLEPGRVGQAVLFRTGFSDAALASMRSLLEAGGIKVANESFGCKGRFLIFNLGHPGAKDLEAGAAFARKMAALAGSPR
jgi:hypothetical protein